MSGVHACRVEDLAYWMHVQLWEVELGGQIVKGDHLVAASRGRLVRRLDHWEVVSAAFGEWVVWRTRDQAAGQLVGVGVGAARRRLGACEDLASLQTAAGELRDDSSIGPGGRRALDWLLDNLGDLPNPVAAGHTSARAAADLTATRDPRDPAHVRAFDAERRAQSAWLAAQLRL